MQKKFLPSEIHDLKEYGVDEADELKFILNLK